MHRKRLKQTLDRRIVTRCSPDTKKHILKDKKKTVIKKTQIFERWHDDGFGMSHH